MYSRLPVLFPVARGREEVHDDQRNLLVEIFTEFLNWSNRRSGSRMNDAQQARNTVASLLSGISLSVHAKQIG